MQLINLKSATKAAFIFLLLFYSKIIFAQTAPSAPTGLRVTATECGKISLAWDLYVPQNGTVSFYYISRSTSENGIYNNVGSLNSSLLTFDDNGAYSDLYAGQPYYYKISAFISLPLGNSINTELSNSVITTITCPTAPTLQISTSNCTSPVLTWEDFPSQYSETGFQIWRQENNQDFNRVATVGANVFTYTDLAELNDGINYTYELRGVFNNKVITLPSNKIVNNYQCVVNNNFRVTESGCNNIKLNWDNDPNYNITDFDLALTFNGRYTFENHQYISLTSNTFTYQINGEPNYNYYFKLRAKISNNIYTERQIANTSVNCNIPTGLQVLNSTCTAVSLSWNQMPTNTNHSKFYIYRSNKYNLGFGTKIGEVGPSVTSFIDNFSNGQSITAGEEIFYTITTLTGLYTESKPSVATSVILNCPIPQNVQIVSTDCEKINISWADFPSGINETGYKIYRSEAGQNYFSAVVGWNVPANTISFSDTYGLENGKSYVYKIEGVFNNYINSISSIESSSVQYNCQINNNLQLVNATCGRIEINWVNPTNLILNGLQVIVKEKNSLKQIYNSSIPSNSNSFIFDFAEPNIEYQFSILYLTNTNNQISSNAIEASFSCPTPSNLRVISADCGKISIQWDDLPSQYNETGYKIVAYDLLFPNQITEIGTVGPNITSFDILGVNYFQIAQSIISKNFRIGVIGLFNYSNTLTSNLVSTGFVCQAVSPNAQLISASCGSIKIGWNDISNLQETGYEILRAEKNVGLYYTIGNVPANIFEYTDNGNLKADKEYSYKIKARFNGNLVEAGSSISASFTCPIPSGLRITQNDCNKIKVEWDDFVPEIQESGYYLYYSYNKPFDPGAGYYIAGPNITSYEITSIRPNETIYFYLVAKFNNSFSTFSNSISTVLNCSSENYDFGLRITSNTCEGVRLEWNKLPAANIVSDISLSRYTLTADGSYIGNASTGASFDNSITFYNDLGFKDYYTGEDRATLVSGEKYYYSMRATVNGKYVYNEPITNVFSCPGNINLTITNGVNCNGPILTWTDNSQNFNATKYIIKRGNEIIGYTEANVFTFTDNGNSFNYNSDPLLPNKNYIYTVTAYKFNFNIVSNIATGQFTCNSNIILSSVPNCNKIVLNWTDNEVNIPATGYAIFLKQDFPPFQPYKIGEVNGNKTSFETNFEIQEGLEYTFLISKKIGNLFTGFSNEVSTSFNCKNEPILSISNTGCRFITLNFNGNNIEKPDKITIYRSYDGIYGYNVPIANLEGTETSFTDYSSRYLPTSPSYVNLLEDSHIYRYRIVFHYGLVQTGFETGIDASFDCQNSPIITGINGTIINCNDVQFTWDPLNIDSNSFDGITFYIFKSDNGINGEYKLIGGRNSNNDNYPLSGIPIYPNTLITGKTYFYKIQYLTNQLYSKFSDPIEIKFNPMVSIKSGLWTDPTTWSCGRVPTSLDEILINNGHKVTIGENLIGNAKNITNNGELEFGTNSTIILH